MTGLRLKIAFPLAVAASQWLGSGALAAPPTAPQRTVLMRVRTAHEMVTSHQRELPPTQVADGGTISAKQLGRGSRINYLRKSPAGEAEFTLDERGRTRSMVMTWGAHVRSYQSAGELKRRDGSGVSALVAMDAHDYFVDLHFASPVGEAKGVTIVVGPRDNWRPSSRTIEKVAVHGPDRAQTSFARELIEERFGKTPVAAYVRIDGPAGTEHLNLDGRPGANFPIGD